MRVTRYQLRKLILREMKYLNEAEGLEDKELLTLQHLANNLNRNPKSRQAKQFKQILDGMKKNAPAKYNDAMSNDLVRSAAEKVYKKADKDLGKKPISPGQLRKILRNAPFNVRSGFTTYAKSKRDGREGVLIFGLSERDSANLDKIFGGMGGLKKLNKYHGPEKGVKSVVIHNDPREARAYNMAGGSAAPKRIEDDRRFEGEFNREKFEAILKKSKTKVILFQLK